MKLDDLCLTFSPYAWLKLIYLLHAGDTEVGGYGVAEYPDYPLYITDILVPKQQTNSVNVDFDMEDWVTIQDEQVAKGLHIRQFARIWIHTHPSGSANPSLTDLKTFDEAFGRCDWAIMAIVSKSHKTFARFKMQGLFSVEKDIPIVVDWKATEASVTRIHAEGYTDWKDLYASKIFPIPFQARGFMGWPPAVYQSTYGAMEAQQTQQTQTASTSKEVETLLDSEGKPFKTSRDFENYSEWYVYLQMLDYDDYDLAVDLDDEMDRQEEMKEAYREEKRQTKREKRQRRRQRNDLKDVRLAISDGTAVTEQKVKEALDKRQTQEWRNEVTLFDKEIDDAAAARQLDHGYDGAYARDSR